MDGLVDYKESHQEIDIASIHILDNTSVMKYLNNQENAISQPIITILLSNYIILHQKIHNTNIKQSKKQNTKNTQIPSKCDFPLKQENHSPIDMSFWQQ